MNPQQKMHLESNSQFCLPLKTIMLSKTEMLDVSNNALNASFNKEYCLNCQYCLKELILEASNK